VNVRNDRTVRAPVLLRPVTVRTRHGDTDPDLALEPSLEVNPVLAAALRQQKRMDEAEKALANSIARNPENLYLVRDLGWLFVAEKKNQPALELFDREVSSHPDQLWLCLEAAKAATALGEYERAAGWYDTALVSGRLNEKQTRNALLGLAEARRRQGKIRPALIAYERLLETEPDNRAFRQMAKELQLELDRQE